MRESGLLGQFVLLLKSADCYLQVSAIPSWHHIAVRRPDQGVHLSASITHPFTDMSVLEQS